MPSSPRRPAAFTLAEILLALGLISVSILTLLALSISTVKANRKSTYVVDASQVAMKLMAEVADRAASDPGFWGSDFRTDPYEEGTHKAGRAEYEYRVFAQTLVDKQSGSDLGSGAPSNRVKKMDIVVEWQADSPGAGRGKRTVRGSCLVNER